MQERENLEEERRRVEELKRRCKEKEKLIPSQQESQQEQLMLQLQKASRTFSAWVEDDSYSYSFG